MNSMIKYLLLLAAAVLTANCSDENGGTDPVTPDKPDEPQKEIIVADVDSPVIFKKGMDGYHTFRIPALTKTTKGTILAFCEGRKNSGSDTGDINLVLRRSADGGKTWSKIIVVWDDADNTCGNPAPAVDPKTGRIHLLMTWNNGSDGKSAGDFNTPGKTKDTRRPYYCYSDDDGRTWSKPVDITSQAKESDWGWYATGPCHAIVLEHGEHAGRILVPCDHNVIGGSGYSHVIYSDDNGKTWKIGGSVKGGNESAVAELADGTVVITCRQSGTRLLSWSKDGGVTFTGNKSMTSLPDPRCQASIINAVYNGEEVLFHSNCANAGSRVQMTVKASKDGGNTWSAGYEVWSKYTAYSDMVLISDKVLGLFYENGDSGSYERINFERVPMGYCL